MNTKHIFFILFAGLFLLSVMASDSYAAATGGTITSDGQFIVHTFTANGTFNITTPITNATILVVAGGGGGACAGGGGAGGLIYQTGYNINSNTNVIIGQGGLGRVDTQGYNGTNSIFNNLTAAGGGAGGGYVVSPQGANGGSGGGTAQGGSYQIGLGTAGQGRNGSNNGGFDVINPYPGGGGGGAGTNAAIPAGGGQGGAGGNGTYINITGTATWYAGGGGGGTGGAGTNSIGGLGGGGYGSGSSTSGQNGTNGLGGGGGGATASGIGGRGGSGIVIIRYLNSTPINPSITFDSQSPVNFTIANTITQISNITFNTVDMNISTIKMYATTNSTANNIKDITAGVSSFNPTEISCVNTSSTQIRCGMNDNKILRGIYNYNQTTMESSTLTSLKSFNNANDRFRQQFQSSDFNYTFIFYEFNCNGSTAANIEVWYYNSSLTSVLLGTTPANSAFNHRHSATSAHHVIGITYNITSKTINGIKATNPFYVEIRGTSGATFACYGLSGVSGVDTLQQSINGGASYSSIVATSDTHVHAFNVNTTFSFIAAGVGLDGLNYSSVRQNDLLESFVLPPSTPVLGTIPSAHQNTTHNISWSVSFSPQFTSLLNYRLAMYHPNLTFIRNISGVSGVSTSYIINYTDAFGPYIIGIYATDTDMLTSGIYYSNEFNITQPCISNFTCIDYGVCSIFNITSCHSVSDITCGVPFGGNLTSYDLSCVYTPPPSLSLAGFDLSNSNNVLILLVSALLWIGVMSLAFIFNNQGFAAFGWFIGMAIGFMFGSVSIWLSLVFLLLNTFIVIRYGSRMH